MEALRGIGEVAAVPNATSGDRDTTSFDTGAFTSFLVFYAFPHVEWLRPYKTYQHPAFVSWLFCMIVMIVVSLMTPEPPAEKVDGVIWDRHYAKLPLELSQRYRGWRDYRIWWAGFVGSILTIYGFFVWWRFEHPASATSVW